MIVKASVLARTLGISRFTMRDLCRRDPKLAFKQGRDYYIRLEELAKRPGFDLVQALLLPHSDKWIKAVDLARMAGVPRRTVAYWCKTRPWFAKRIGRTWYVSAEVLGTTQEEAEFLEKWAPQCKTAIQLAAFVGEESKNHEDY